MPFPEPEYSQQIIVGVVFHTTFSWYVTERDYWYLDYTKYDRALLAIGRTDPVIGNYSSRFHIAILNEDTAESFLVQIENCRVPASALSHMMVDQRKLYEEYASLRSPEYVAARLDFSPCLFVNFDQRQFASQYPEMIRFENYIPDGWIGTYRSFVSEIPEEEKYWIVDGHTLFES